MATLHEIAAAVVPGHADWLARGYKLGGKSGAWLTRRHTITARLVYRRGDVTVVFCIREIPLEYGDG